MTTSYSKNLYNKLSTGDLLLFHGTATVSCCIEFFTKSKFSHIGMILKDPVMIDDKLEGLYLWESGKEDFPDAEDNEHIYGVMISPLDKVINEYGIENCFVRCLNNNKTINLNDIKNIHESVHHLPYDLNPIDWLEAGLYELHNLTDVNYTDKLKLIKKKSKVKTPKSVWCSALIGYIYYRLQLINNPYWKLLSPEDWTFKKEKILKLNGCYLTKEKSLANL